MKPLAVASVCSGIGGAELAFEGHTHVFASEIDPFAREVLTHHFPHIPLYGDFTEITNAAGPDQTGPVDVLVGGTPCQSFSIAGLRGGMADSRGNLALEFLRLAQRLSTTWILWENVPGVLSSNEGRDFGAFVGGLAELGYGFAYRVLDAQYFGLAQRRKRVFVVGYLGDWRRAAAVLFEPACLRGNPPPRRTTRERTARPLASCAPGSSGYRNDADTADNLVASRLIADLRNGTTSDTAMSIQAGGAREDRGRCINAIPHVLAYGGNRQSGPVDIATAVNAHGGPHGRLDFESETFVTHSLRADGFDAGEDGTGRGTPLITAFTQNQRNEVRLMDVAGACAAEPGAKQQTYVQAFTTAEQSNAFAWERDVYPTLDTMTPNDTRNIQQGVRIGSTVRRLTPTECERLQGYPPGWTDVPYRGKRAADGNRYRALGNAFAVPVVKWIANRISIDP